MEGPLEGPTEVPMEGSMEGPMESPFQGPMESSWRALWRALWTLWRALQSVMLLCESALGHWYGIIKKPEQWTRSKAYELPSMFL